MYQRATMTTMKNGFADKEDTAKMKKLALIGCGKLSDVIAAAIEKNLLPGYEMAAAMSHKKEDAERFVSRTGGKSASTIEELLETKPDYVMEIASVESVKTYALPVLEAGISLIPLSIGAFADREFYERVQNAARAGGAKLYIPHGAVGGFDVLSTVGLMAEAEGKELKAGISTRKGPKSLENSPVYRPEMETQEMTAFEGTCEEAIALLPTKVNVAVAQSLTTIGPEKAAAAITSVLGYVGDEHTITAQMDGIKVVSQVYSANAGIAAWSIVSLLRNLENPVCFF